jgi:membrane-associated phospholipid phosphatase
MDMMNQRIELLPPTPRPPLIPILNRIQSFDEHLIQTVATKRPHGRNHPANLLMRGLTRTGDWDVWTTLLIGLAIFGEPYREAALRAAPSLIVTFLVSQGLKRLARRPRPSVKLPDLSRLLGNPDEFSFPSSHTACAWAICLGLGYQIPVLMFPGIALAAGIGWSRIHVGAHYLTDILAGAALGAGISLILA